MALEKNPPSSHDADERIHVSLTRLAALRYQARGFSFLPKQPVKSVLTGRKRSAIRGRGLDFIEMRDYRPGDDIRTMDWRVTNRTGRPHVRVYAEEKDRSVVLIVDQRRSMFFGSQWKMKSVIAAELAALSAWRVLDVGDRVGAVIFNDSDIEEFKPSRNQSSVLQMLSRLSQLNGSLSEAPGLKQTGIEQVGIEQVLKEAERLVGHDYLVVLISDFSDWGDTALKRLKSIAQHNDVIAGLVFDPLESDISKADQLVVSDGRYQLEIDTSDQTLSEKFQEGFQNSVDSLQSEFRKYDIPVLQISTETAVFEQLRKQLGGTR
ncbi:MAG: hypothetical protein ACJASL_001772 [Paraglaciecola sp.]|jgi:uncharacterized protein (DUF58 family)